MPYPAVNTLLDDILGQKGTLNYWKSGFLRDLSDAAIDVLVEERLVERSAELGPWMKAQLEAMNSPHIKELRGIGLWYGLELHPEAGGARKFCVALQHEGMLCKETHTHTIRLAPPLVVTKTDLEWALERLRRVLGAK